MARRILIALGLVVILAVIATEAYRIVVELQWFGVIP